MTFILQNKKGFSAVEVLVVVAILVILSALVVTTFSVKLRSSTVDRDSENTLSYLTKARNQSVASLDNSSFGVHFSSSTVDFFKGTSYEEGTAKTSYPLSGSNITTSLSGGVSELYFARISGEPSATGTITISSKSNASSTRTITIRATGLAE